MRRFAVRRLPMAATLLALAACARHSGSAPAPAPASGGPVLLRIAPPQGQVSHYRAEMQMFMHLPAMPAMDSTTPFMTQQIDLTQTVTALEGEVRVLRMVTDSLHTDMPALAGMIPTPPVDELRGMTITMRMDPRGHVLSTEVSGGNLPPEIARQLSNVSSLGGRWPKFPEGPVRVGETWSDSQAISMPAGPAQVSGWMRITYRLERLEQNGAARIAVLSANGTLANSGGAGGAGRFAMTGTMTAENVMDLDAGRLVRMGFTMNAQMEAPQLGASVPVRMVMTMRLVP